MNKMDNRTRITQMTRIFTDFKIKKSAEISVIRVIRVPNNKNKWIY